MKPQHLCQLAGQWSGGAPADWVVLEAKLDGWRGLWLRDHEGKPGLFTRNGMPIEGTGHIAHRLEQMEAAAGEPLFIDGEFVVDGSDTLAATKHWCEAGWKIGGEAGTLWAFDCLTWAEWRRGGSDRPWHERKAMLEALEAAVAADSDAAWTWRPGSRGRDEDAPPAVRIVKHRQVFTADEVVGLAVETWNAGGEGIVLKDASAPYRRTRANAWMKIGRPWQKRLGWTPT